MKLPSIAQIWSDCNYSFQRFPLTIISAVIGTVVSIALVEQKVPDAPSMLYSTLQSAILALPLITALRLAAEKDGAMSGGGWALQGIGVVLLVVYAFIVPDDVPHAPLYYHFRFFAFAVICCFLLSFLPFQHKGMVNGFWQFNKILVFRIVLAGAFALVLFAGLGLALAALDNLFGIDIPPERYLELWILILGLFVVPFILTGIPDKLSELDSVSDYPKSLKILGQYVLSPLVLVYFVILYAYIAKIVFTWNWPQGWVGRLILGFSATGILALFVLDPLREKAQNLWIKRASRWYYVILLPLVVVLFLSLWRRISEYGITEGRYLGLAIGVWLAFTAVYFLLSRTKSIKMIPASLFVITLLISVGPWGMFSVSEQSQIGRLKQILVADSILVDGKVQQAPSPVSQDDEAQISAILTYLHQVHGFAGIEPWFVETLHFDSAGTGVRFKQPSYVAELLGIEYRYYGYLLPNRVFSVAIDPKATIPVSGYDHMVRVEYRSSVLKEELVEQPIVNEITAYADSMTVGILTDSTNSDSVTIPLRSLIERLASAHEGSGGKWVSGEKATLTHETAGFKAKVVMIRATVEQNDSTIMADSYDALIFYARNGEE